MGQERLRLAEERTKFEYDKVSFIKNPIKSNPTVCCMKNKWGSPNPTSKTNLLNTNLAQKPRECLEYIVVHELVHLLEPTHIDSFIKLMDQHTPKWQSGMRTGSTEIDKY